MRSRSRHVLAVAIVSAALINGGFMQAAHAGVVGTVEMVETSRDASIASIRSQLERDDVRTQLGKFGVSTEVVNQRLETLTDAELATLSKRLHDAPAGGDGLLVVLGVTFVVLLVLELVGVIDIFKKVPSR